MALSDISSIRTVLHNEALNKGFYKKSEEELTDQANNFVEDFCIRNGLSSHTVRPLSWSFESPESGMIDDGIIELNNPGDDAQFIAVDVSNAKLTDKDNVMND